MRALAHLLTRRLWQMALVAALVGTLTLVLTRALPGDAAWRIAAGRYGYDRVDAAAAEAVRAELDLDGNAFIAWLHWMGDLLQLNLGRSLVSGEPVIDELFHQLGHSAVLAGAAVALALLLGPPLGALAGLRPGGWLDRFNLLLAVVLRALPAFVLGVLLIAVFSLWLGVLPSAGYDTPAHLLLPALSLALGLAAVSGRVTRQSVREVRESPMYAFSLLRGMSAVTTFRRHGIRNAAVPVVTYLGVQLVYLIEGVVVIETLFAWPGIGHALVHAIVARDVPMVQGTALVMGLVFVLLNLLVDIACLLIDPRRRRT